ncbi:MAG: hypothetical protein KAT79_02160 [candidate division Zixibacteria bacterium]|nr:hypothetical protein [candidate division Zixibacteria bacterium]
MKLLAVMIGVVILVGCGGRQQVIYNQPELPSEGYWDMVWVEPSIVLSDSLFTLIRADRLDSIYVKVDSDPFAALPTSVVFGVGESVCFVAVDLVDASGRIVLPIVARELIAGHYKLTINRSRVSSETYPSGLYYLQARYCGKSIKSRLHL